MTFFFSSTRFDHKIDIYQVAKDLFWYDESDFYGNIGLSSVYDLIKQTR